MAISAAYVFFELIPLTWGVASFRAGDIDPDTVRLVNDAGWFIFLFTIPPYCLWLILIGVAILSDKNVPTIYPRWVGYANIWAGVGSFPAVLMRLAKDGPFAYNGVFAFWLPLTTAATWFAIMTVVTLRAISNEERKNTEDGATETPGVAALA